LKGWKEKVRLFISDRSMKASLSIKDAHWSIWSMKG